MSGNVRKLVPFYVPGQGETVNEQLSTYADNRVESQQLIPFNVRQWDQNEGYFRDTVHLVRDHPPIKTVPPSPRPLSTPTSRPQSRPGRRQPLIPAPPSRNALATNANLARSKPKVQAKTLAKSHSLRLLTPAEIRQASKTSKRISPEKSKRPLSVPVQSMQPKNRISLGSSEFLSPSKIRQAAQNRGAAFGHPSQSQPALGRVSPSKPAAVKTAASREAEPFSLSAIMSSPELSFLGNETGPLSSDPAVLHRNNSSVYRSSRDNVQGTQRQQRRSERKESRKSERKQTKSERKVERSNNRKSLPNGALNNRVPLPQTRIVPVSRGGKTKSLSRDSGKPPSLSGPVPPQQSNTPQMSSSLPQVYPLSSSRPNNEEQTNFDESRPFAGSTFETASPPPSKLPIPRFVQPKIRAETPHISVIDREQAALDLKRLLQI